MDTKQVGHGPVEQTLHLLATKPIKPWASTLLRLNSVGLGFITLLFNMEALGVLITFLLVFLSIAAVTQKAIDMFNGEPDAPLWNKPEEE